MSDETQAAASVTGEPVSQEPQAAPVTPEPRAIGDRNISIYSHTLCEASVDPVDQSRSPAALEIALGNELATAIACVTLDVRFLDAAGEVLDTVRHKEVDLRANGSRAIRVVSSEYRLDAVKSYDVKVVRSTTADTEKVQLRRHDMRTTAAGEEELHGIVKNISAATASAAVLATYYNADREIIGTRAVVLRDIEAGEIRQYELTFKPQEGDVVSSFSLAVGEIAGT